jgi:hypothetical protein
VGLRPPCPAASGFKQALLIRRPLDAPDDPKKLAYYLTFAPAGTLLETLVAVAGRRWAIEESVDAAKGEVGLDHYKVRHFHGWYRHITLALVAQLATHDGLIPLTVPEVRRLVYRLVVRALAPPDLVLHWCAGVACTRPGRCAATTGSDALGMCCRRKQ